MFDLDTPRRISLLIVLVYAAVYFIAVRINSALTQNRI